MAPENREFLTGRDVWIGREIGYLTMDVEHSLQCRHCASDDARKALRHAWNWMRVESAGLAIISRDAPDKLGVKFECIDCGAIHLAMPLPAKRHKRDDKTWSIEDPAVACILATLHSWVRKPPAKERATNHMAQRNAGEETPAQESGAQEAAGETTRTPSSKLPPEKDCARSPAPAAPAPAREAPPPPPNPPNAGATKGGSATPARPK